MREPTQRFWDAIIIREWYRFGSAKDLQRICMAEFGCFTSDLPLHRIENCYGGVRAWVANTMPMLSHKLLTTPKERSLEVLDWLGKTKVRCEHNKSWTKHINEATDSVRRSELRVQQKEISYDLEKLLNRSNQSNIVKSTSPRRYSK